MAKYIVPPLRSSTEEIAQAAFSFLQTYAEDWEPSEGQLDTWMIRANAAEGAELRDLASSTLDSIFRFFGPIVNITPQDETTSFVNSTWTVVNNNGYTIPAGTQVAIPNSVGEIIPFQVLTQVVIPAGQTATAAGGVTLISVNPGSATAGVGGVGVHVGLIDTLVFVTDIVLTGLSTGGMDEEDDDVYMDRLSRRLRLLSDGAVLPADFAQLAMDEPGVFRALAIDLYNVDYNALTLNQSSLETDTTGWAALTNSTIARDTAQHSDGAASLRIRSVAAGTMSAATSPNNQHAVLPGERWTAIAEFKAGTVARSCRLRIQWRDAAQAALSLTDGVAANDNTTSFSQYVVSGVAPASAAFANIVAEVTSTGAANEDHFVDKIAFRRTSSTTWMPGGTPETNNEKMLALVLQGDDGLAVSAPVKASVAANAEARREVNFSVGVLDPVITAVDVNVNATKEDGFDAQTVDDSVVAALQAYLNPKNWGSSPNDPEEWRNDTVVRIYELATVVNNVLGVRNITLLQVRWGTNAFAATDTTLPGVAPLPSAGTMTVNIT